MTQAFHLSVRSLAFALLSWWWVSPAVAEEPQAWAKRHLPELFSLYQEFHKSPELSLQEERTGMKLAGELRSLGLDVTDHFGGHGVVGLLKNGDGPTVLVRADLDGLPVTENTNLAYASQVKVRDDSGRETGVMHACGHDIHITCLIGVARYLAAHKEDWHGTVMFIGQPAEERGDGAKAMLDEGLFEKFPKPDFGLALHVDSSLAAGKVGHLAGYTHANVDSVDITVRGRGGHGARPETTIDPVVIAAYLIVDLQTIVSREIAPADSAVITVGSIHGGTKHNIIGDSCHLELTVRSYSDESREHLLEAITRKAKAAAASAKAPEPIVNVSEYTPAVLNDEGIMNRLVPVFRQLLGEENVVPATRTMGGEDFSRYGRAGVPIFMFRLGSVEAKRLARFGQLGQEVPSLHSALYYPDAEETLATGVGCMSAAVLEMIK
ncbi:MAG: amidohydrolase [Pirellulales bacterium]